MASKGNDALLQGLPELSAATKIAIVKTEWNNHITDELERGALKVIAEAGITKVKTYAVPGAVEVPYLIRQIDQSLTEKADAYIAFACVIKGDTPHFDYVCQSITQGITLLNVQLQAPVIYGVLTVNNEEQALERIGGVHGHKGKEAAITAIKMIFLRYHVSA